MLNKVGSIAVPVSFTAVLLTLGACSGASVSVHNPPMTVTLEQDHPPAEELSTRTFTSPDSVQLGYTYHRPDGNRFVEGTGSLPEIGPSEIQVGFIPIWVVGAPVQSGSIWVAVSAKGEVEGILVEGGVVSHIPVDSGNYPAGSPPLVVVDGPAVSLVSAPEENASELTHPVLIQQNAGMAWIDKRGRLNLTADEKLITLEVQALPDARLIQDDQGRLLVLSDPSELYDHAVLGDGIEARGVTLIETTPEFRIVRRISVPVGLVIEGMMPLWVDLNNDGTREIVLTASDRSLGARLMVYTEQGQLIAESEPIGQGYRWRHQIGVASASEGGPAEVISVRTPHIGGLLEYFRLIDDRLELVATLEGVSSHVIGTRNLDLALSGDFDGDGLVETLLPDSEHRSLLAAQRTQGGVYVDWRLQLDDTISSNLAAVTDGRGRISIAVGLQNGSLWVWSPQVN
jgi:hypothetical protein